MKDRAKYYKSLFITYFDGGYQIDPEPNTSSTYSMGVCKLDFIESENKLVIYLRRPGLLIGKGGRTIDALRERLDINIDIVEVDIYNDNILKV